MEVEDKDKLKELAESWRQRAKAICTGDDQADNAKDSALCGCADELEELLGS